MTFANIATVQDTILKVRGNALCAMVTGRQIPNKRNRRNSVSKRDIKAKRWDRRKLKRIHASWCRDYERYLTVCGRRPGKQTIFKSRSVGWTGYDIGGGEHGHR